MLDHALIAAQQPDPSRLAALRPALGRSADTVLDGPGSIAERVVRARAAIRARMEREEAAVTGRIRLLIIVLTLLVGLVGVGILGLSSHG